MTDDRYAASPPVMDGVSWGLLADEDLPAVIALAVRCAARDGGLPLAAEEAFVRERFWSAERRRGLGAFDTSDRLIAATLVQGVREAGVRRLTQFGLVDPTWRGRGFGRYLLFWSEAQTSVIDTAGGGGDPIRMVCSTETLTAEAEALFAAVGLEQMFGEAVMRRNLTVALPEAPLHPEITLSPWSAERAGRFFEAYSASFRDRPGFPGWPAERWINWISDDEDFRPELTLLASAGEQPVGFVACGDNYIVQIGVRPEWRRRGIASAMLVIAMEGMRAKGDQEALLTVAFNNPTATQVYTGMGFETIGRRARYEKTLHTPECDVTRTS